MNKRQKKKQWKRIGLCPDFGPPSYRKNKEFERAYHEYEVVIKRQHKICAGCEYFIGLDLCERNFNFLPCVKEKAA